MRLGVHGSNGRQQPKPVAEAKVIGKAIEVAEADFAIVDAELKYEQAWKGRRRSRLSTSCRGASYST